LSELKKTIELNGKLYDAHTGRVIDDASKIPEQTAAQQPAKKHAPKRPSTAVVMDGFTPVHRTNTPAHAHRKLEHSKTLMRPAVKKPVIVAQKVVELTRAEMLAQNSKDRSDRAKQTTKSSFIKRFGHPDHSAGVNKVHQSLPVAQPRHDISHSVAEVAHSAQIEISKSAKLVEDAIASSSSHLMTFEKELIAKKGFWQRVGWKNKTANISSLVAACALLVGFFAWQNVTQIEMRVASTRAGVSAHLPGYNPAGFGVAGGVHTEPGKVTVSYKSRTDDRQFQISQQASNWNSDSLLSNYFLNSNRPTPITYPDEGKTIYIYGDSNATWVDAGVWYNIEGNSNLTTDQLLRLANSL
jgi:hypothetical protein